MTAGAIRLRLREFRQKSTWTAGLLFLIDLAVYFAGLYFAIRSTGHAARWCAGTVEGFAIGLLFVVGHDACHGSLVKSRWMNRTIGRIAFLPSLTPYSLWDLGHNQTHHVYTNLKQIDYVWTPFSKSEYDSLPDWRRLAERVYRSLPGLGLYYCVEIWWKYLFFPDARNVSPRKAVHLIDSCACLAYGLILSGVALSAGIETFCAAVLWPFAIWNWLMGWAIYGHHTHPSVAWFDSESEWRQAQVQVRCTVHVKLPALASLFLHNIMDHTAHHLDVTIPLYQLRNAQSALESEVRGVVIQDWSPRALLKHLKICRLYDYREHRWLNYSGSPLSQPPDWVAQLNGGINDCIGTERLTQS